MVPFGAEPQYGIFLNSPKPERFLSMKRNLSASGEASLGLNLSKARLRTSG